MLGKPFGGGLLTQAETLKCEQMADAVRRAGRVAIRRNALYHYLDAPVPKG